MICAVVMIYARGFLYIPYPLSPLLLQFFFLTYTVMYIETRLDICNFGELYYYTMRVGTHPLPPPVTGLFFGIGFGNHAFAN